MAGKMNETINLNRLKTSLLKSAGNKHRDEYDPETDTLIMFYAESDHSELLITHYIDEYVFILFRHSDKEIVAVGVEGFVSGFGPAYEKAGQWSINQTGIKLVDVEDFTILIRRREAKTEPKPEPKPIKIQLKAIQATSDANRYLLRPEYEFSR